MSWNSNMSGVTTVAPSHTEGPKKLVGVDVRLENGERGVVPALRIGGQASARAHDAHGRLVRAEVGRDDRHVGPESVEQAA